MGAVQSNGPMDAASVRMCFDPAGHFSSGRGDQRKTNPDGAEEGWGSDALSTYSIIGGRPECITKAEEMIRALRAAHALGDPELRAANASLGCVLGNAIGDALGAPLEFEPLCYGSTRLRGLDHAAVWSEGGTSNSFNLKPGQWTDDDSMGLCIVDSLLVCGEFDGRDLRQRFRAWNTYGYNNAFGRDGGRASVGLGGNISMSMEEWCETGEPMTTAGNQYTSGNGSVMRNGAIPVWFRNDLTKGMEAAYGQSRSTHRGEEAAELCRLLTYICVYFINGAGRELLNDLTHFETPLYNVRCLARGECEEAHEHNADPVFGGDLALRRWNWKIADYRYCEKRAQENPGYIGSYAMDNVSMALHCVYSTQTFTEATLKAANLCGDSDSVCAVVGQLAGALYGATSIPPAWLDVLQQWDGGTIAARALMLHEHVTIGREGSLTDAACETTALLGTPVSTK